MKIPLGDILRAFFSWGWLKKTKGITLELDGHEIQLNEGHGISRPGESKFDRTPSRPKPRFGPGS